MFLKDRIAFILFCAFISIIRSCEGQEEINAEAEKYLREFSNAHSAVDGKNDKNIPLFEKSKNKPLVSLKGSEVKNDGSILAPEILATLLQYSKVSSLEKFIRTHPYKIMLFGASLIAISSLGLHYCLSRISEGLKQSIIAYTLGGLIFSGFFSMIVPLSTLSQFGFKKQADSSLRSLYYAPVNDIEKASRSSSINYNIGGFESIYLNEIISPDNLQVTGRKIGGVGILKADNILIKAKKFEFEGLIYCNDKCLIVADEPIDENSFLRRGNGEFVFILNDKKE